MVTTYEEINGKLDVYQPYFEAHEEAKKNRVNDRTRQLTAFLTNDRYQQEFFMDYNRSKPVDFRAPLKEKTKIEKESLDDYISHNPVNFILREAPEQDLISNGRFIPGLNSLIEVIRPITNCTGDDADIHNRISRLRQTKDTMAKTIKKRDIGQMKAYTSTFYENYLNEPANNVSEEEKRITKAVIDASPNFVPEFYGKRSEEVSYGLAVELEGKKPDYLTAMIANKYRDADGNNLPIQDNFTKFMVKYKTKAQKEAEREDPYI